GNVTIGDGTTSKSVSVNAGSATLNFPTAGPRTVTLSYPGDVTFDPSSISTPYTVSKAGTTLVFGTISPASSTASQSVTVPFTLNVTSPGAGTPIGNVTVSDGVTSVVVPASS